MCVSMGVCVCVCTVAVCSSTFTETQMQVNRLMNMAEHTNKPTTITMNKNRHAYKMSDV